MLLSKLFRRLLRHRLAAWGGIATVIGSVFAGMFVFRASQNRPVLAFTFIEVTGSNKHWLMRSMDQTGVHPIGPTIFDGAIPVPLGTTVVLILRSTDFIYTLAIPEFHLKELAVPQLNFRIQFRPTHIGRFEFVGEPLCGEPHSEMRGTVIVESLGR